MNDVPQEILDRLRSLEASVTMNRSPDTETIYDLQKTVRGLQAKLDAMADTHAVTIAGLQAMITQRATPSSVAHQIEASLKGVVLDALARESVSLESQFKAELADSLTVSRRAVERAEGAAAANIKHAEAALLQFAAELGA